MAACVGGLVLKTGWSPLPSPPVSPKITGMWPSRSKAVPSTSKLSRGGHPTAPAPRFGRSHRGCFGFWNILLVFPILQLMPIASRQKPNKKIKEEEIIPVRISKIILFRAFPDRCPMLSPDRHFAIPTWVGAHSITAISQRSVNQPAPGPTSL